MYWPNKWWTSDLRELIQMDPLAPQDATTE
jgi:hypothetical protein